VARARRAFVVVERQGRREIVFFFARTHNQAPARQANPRGALRVGLRLGFRWGAAPRCSLRCQRRWRWWRRRLDVFVIFAVSCCIVLSHRGLCPLVGVSLVSFVCCCFFECFFF